jgi:signal transduction histidine kinase
VQQHGLRRYRQLGSEDLAARPLAQVSGPSDAPTVDPVFPMRYLQDPRTAPRPLRVIFIEASEADVAMLTAELALGGFEVTGRRVDSAAGLREVLLANPAQANPEGAPWDIVLADHGLPGLDALAALSVLRELSLDLPFIIVSGAAAEEGAVAALRAGAHDCISKPGLARLVPAVQRELREATTRAEQRRLQEQLMVAERMASVGTLAAGVAHEINNPLAAVVANLELALRTVERLPPELPDLAELRAELRDAHEAAHLVRQIVRDVKVFSRSVDERAGPVDVRQVLDSTVRMAWNEIRHRARLLKQYDAVPPVWTTDARLGQVFLNLLINAAQAIEIGHVDSNQIRLATRTDDRGRAVVEISDTGVGISAENLGRIFAPFFTTKPPGSGTGLGLSISHRIVQELGGELRLTSETGRGTIATVALPAASTTRTSP